MLVSCWSVKGGSGTTVVAASLALLLARQPGGALLVDLEGEAPTVLGMADPAGPGVSEWLAAGAARHALARLEVDAAPGLRLLPRGKEPWGAEAAAPIVEALSDGLPTTLAAGRTVVVDCGVIDEPTARGVAEASGLSLLVLRSCYLSLRRAVAAPIRPSAVILVHEEGRTLGPAEVEDVLAVPVRAVVPWDGGIGRWVDAGLLATRIPRRVALALRQAA